MNTAASAGAARRKAFWEGMRDGVPIGTGYFAVAVALGITAQNAGLSPFQGFLASLLNNASAGEYAGFKVIKALAPYVEIALITLIINARYLLMSCALSQKFSPETPFYHRFLIGFEVTDELFGITIARPGFLEPAYFYGAVSLALPGWSLGTLCGILAGNLLPERVVAALGVALFGMFIAIIIPPARKSRVIGGVVAVSFLLSWLAGIIPGVKTVSEGTRIILLTLLIAGTAAALFPVGEAEEAGESAAKSPESGADHAA